MARVVVGARPGTGSRQSDYGGKALASTLQRAGSASPLTILPCARREAPWHEHRQPPEQLFNSGSDRFFGSPTSFRAVMQWPVPDGT